MSDDIFEVSKELRKELEKLPLFIEYKKIEELYLSNKEILELKKQIVRAKNENRLDDHRELLERYNNHPLVMNYLSLKEDLLDYLSEVSKVINSK